MKPDWKRGEIIRRVLSGKPMLVLHIYSLGDNSSATAVTDLEDAKDPTPLLIIHQRDYANWVPDKDMEYKKNGEMLQWKYNPFKI